MISPFLSGKSEELLPIMNRSIALWNNPPCNGLQIPPWSPPSTVVPACVMSSGEVANPITVEEANQAQLQLRQQSASAASAASAEEEGEESDSAIGDNYADDDFRRMLHSGVSNRRFCISLPLNHQCLSQGRHNVLKVWLS